MKVIATAAALAFAAVSLSGCGGDDATTTAATGNSTTTAADVTTTTAADATTTSGSGPAPTQNIVELASTTDELSTLVTAVTAGDLVDTLSGAGPFTVFAPTNAAFKDLPDGVVDDLLKPESKDALVEVLTYHVVAGKVVAGDITDGLTSPTVEGKHNVTFTTDKDAVKVNFAVVTTADVMATNGVVHIVDHVLLPYDNIVEKASATDTLSTLVTAVTAAELGDTLQAPGPYTVLAPTNDAFSALPAGTVENLLKPENKDQLVGVLTYHVLPTFTLSKDLTDGATPVTVQGQPVTVSVDGTTVKFNEAAVVTPDVLAMNGVVHIIGGVLTPPSDESITV